ncbi:MAG: penicillin-binding transpeptidase domain-containing protein [Corallococcus sp.]|nr:penicillin-binding transpeptidase domain-containing protein [Corallococcus sp.]
MAYIQVVWGKDLQARAAEQWQRDLPINAYRGDIVDTNGILLATTETAYSVYARPQSVKDAEACAAALSKILETDYTVIYEKITKKGVSEVTLKRQIVADKAAEIRSCNLSGIYLASEGARSYAYGDFLSQVLGFVSSDGIGQTGIEAYYDKYLQGIDGVLLTETDLVGSELEDGSMTYIPSVDGLTLTLTIDAVIQTIVENVLALAMYQQNPQAARCIVLDVTTGEILAMASKPSIDLNNLPRDNLEYLMKYSKNTLLTDIYEPGSTFKVLTAAACLEEYYNGNPKAFSAEHVFGNSSGTRIIDGSKISCWTKHANGKHSNQTLSDALNNSCNPIFTDIALSLGKNVMYEYLEKFGYGSATGIDFIGEQAGILVPRSSVTNGDLARIGFGQSIAVTPLQLCMATAAAVNGGLLMQPYLVKEISDPTTGNVVKRFSPTVVNRAISEKTSKQIASMLKRVVDEGGGKNAKIEGYQVGGKTGTAQKFADGALAVGKYVSSFIGFFPADSPKYLTLLIVDEPEGQSYGSIVAAPYAKLVFQEIINYKNIPPFE